MNTIIWVEPDWCTPAGTGYNSQFKERLELAFFDNGGWPDNWDPVLAWESPIQLAGGTKELVDAAKDYGIRIPILWQTEKPPINAFYRRQPISQYNQIWPQ